MPALHIRMLSILCFLFPLLVQAQNSTSTTTYTTSVPVSTISRSRSGTRVITVPTSTIFSATTVVSQVITSVSATSSHSTLNETELDTVIDPAFGVLGALLILSGLPSVFWGHRNRWSTYFVCGFYTFALACIALIIRFGVLEAINPPSETVRGLFVLSCAVAGVVGGGVAIFFWKQTKYFIGGWGGFAVGLFIQALHDGGLVHPLGWRWALYMGSGVVGFVLCTLPKIHYHILLAATACFGATAFMMGVDCYTTAGLKEFYIYNLGFHALFPKYADAKFKVTQTMQIELGMMGAVAVMGMAVQARILVVLQARLREITVEQEKKNAEVEAKAAERFANLDQEVEEWEKEHGRLLGLDPPRKLQDLEASPTLTPGSGRPSSQFSLLGKLGNGQSGGTVGSTSKPTEEKEKNDTPLLSLDLGKSVEESIPANYVSKDAAPTAAELAKDEDLKKKTELLNEIQTIRNSIVQLKQETSAAINAASTSRSATVSLESRYKLDPGASEAQLQPPAHARRRSLDSSTVLSPRAGSTNRAQSFSASTAINPPSTIERPKSTPLGIAAQDWEDYLNNRKLFQPPAGVTAPIPTTPMEPTKPKPKPYEVTMSPAVKEAMETRRQRENVFAEAGPSAAMNFEKQRARTQSATSTHLRTYIAPGNSSDEDLPIATAIANRHKKSVSSVSGMGNYGLGSRTTTPAPIILPPQRGSSRDAHQDQQPEVWTFEELTERHKEKIRALQDPVTKTMEQEAELAAAKNRWERSRAIEKEVMTRRDAERQQQSRSRTPNAAQGHQRRHSRSLSSSEILTSGQPRERRMSSAMKVQEWQRYQETVNSTAAGEHAETPAPRRPVGHQHSASRGSGAGTPVPFPSGMGVNRTSAGWAAPPRRGGKDPVM